MRGLPHTKWECFNNGMFSEQKTNNAKELTLALFYNEKRFYKYCLLVLVNWKNTRYQHLNYLKVNPTSWLGQCANNYANNVKEWETRKLWKEIEFKQQQKCNKIANYALQRYMQGHVK